MTSLADAPLAPATLLHGWDSLELWVGNARSAAHLLVAGWGFRTVAYAGPETGVRDRVSWVLEQGGVRLVVTAGLDRSSEVARHVLVHGDGVKALSFAVDDVEKAFQAAVRRGAVPVAGPQIAADVDGEVVSAAVRTYGDTDHRFTTRRHPAHAPGFTTEGLFSVELGGPVGIDLVDHVVGNVPQGRLEDWVAFYESVFGFAQMTHFDRDQISTEYSALRSTVMTNGQGITLPINEPATGLRRSQIQEYLDAYVGAGVQHVALATTDIVGTVGELRRRGIRFLTPPSSYYAMARARMGELGAELPWDELARLGILVDREAGGYLLQVFSETLGDRPTLFFEVIQREGATGFGEGNFKALFEAIEREQARRGNL